MTHPLVESLLQAGAGLLVKRYPSLFDAQHHLPLLHEAGIALPFEPVPNPSAWRCLECGAWRQFHVYVSHDGYIRFQPMQHANDWPRYGSDLPSCDAWTHKHRVIERGFGSAKEVLVGSQHHSASASNRVPGFRVCGGRQWEWVHAERARQQIVFLGAIEGYINVRAELGAVSAMTATYQHLPFPEEWLPQEFLLQASILGRLQRIEGALREVIDRMQSAGHSLAGY